MITKGSKLYSILLQKCPNCHEGKMFEHAVWSSKFAKMNDNCSHCGFDFKQEPSYYFGAMYVSYGIQVAIFVGIFLLLRYTIDPHPDVYIYSMIAATVLIIPWNFRISRSAWINMFVSYKQFGKQTSIKPE